MGYSTKDGRSLHRRFDMIGHPEDEQGDGDEGLSLLEARPDGIYVKSMADDKEQRFEEISFITGDTEGRRKSDLPLLPIPFTVEELRRVQGGALGIAEGIYCGDETEGALTKLGFLDPMAEEVARALGIASPSRQDKEDEQSDDATPKQRPVEASDARLPAIEIVLPHSLDGFYRFGDLPWQISESLVPDDEDAKDWIRCVYTWRDDDSEDGVFERRLAPDGVRADRVTDASQWAPQVVTASKVPTEPSSRYFHWLWHMQRQGVDWHHRLSDGSLVIHHDVEPRETRLILNRALHRDNYDKELAAAVQSSALEVCNSSGLPQRHRVGQMLKDSVVHIDSLNTWGATLPGGQRFVMESPTHQSNEATSHFQPPMDEAKALRGCLAILAPTLTPIERRDMMLNIEKRISGQDTALLLFSFEQIGALFHPIDAEKAKLLAERLRCAVDTGELVGIVPPEHGRVALSELASWPGCPSVPDGSPLGYWLPLQPQGWRGVGTPAQQDIRDGGHESGRPHQSAEGKPWVWTIDAAEAMAKRDAGDHFNEVSLTKSWTKRLVKYVRDGHILMYCSLEKRERKAETVEESFSPSAGYRVLRTTVDNWLLNIGHPPLYRSADDASPTVEQPQQEAQAEQLGSSASTSSQIPHWKMRIQAAATEHMKTLRKSGASPTVNSIVDQMAKWCRDNNVKTDGGIFPSANYLRTHVLGGKHRTPPA
jgi:hypothetical protein